MRPAEFDDLFASALRAQYRPSPTTLRRELDPATERCGWTSRCHPNT
ncbi:hypothetical protein [Paractinoplanes durhamensis]